MLKHIEHSRIKTWKMENGTNDFRPMTKITQQKQVAMLRIKFPTSFQNIHNISLSFSHNIYVEGLLFSRPWVCRGGLLESSCSDPHRGIRAMLLLLLRINQSNQSINRTETNWINRANRIEPNQSISWSYVHLNFNLILLIWTASNLCSQFVLFAAPRDDCCLFVVCEQRRHYKYNFVNGAKIIIIILAPLTIIMVNRIAIIIGNRIEIIIAIRISRSHYLINFMSNETADRTI